MHYIKLWVKCGRNSEFFFGRYTPDFKNMFYNYVLSKYKPKLSNVRAIDKLLATFFVEKTRVSFFSSSKFGTRVYTPKLLSLIHLKF
jgi:hypothetical protein